MDLLETLHKSADLIKSSKRMLLLTSAGMSADSNIPTFRDKDGYWKNFPPFKEKNLEAHPSPKPITHPLVDQYFSRFEKGSYQVEVS